MADNKELYTRTIKAGSTIFAEGDAGDHAYIVESGSIEVHVTENGEPVVLGNLGSGALLGEMALIDDAHRTATAVAAEDTVLSVLNQDQLHSRLSKADPVLRMLVNLLISRYRSILHHLSDSGAMEKVESWQPSSAIGEQDLAMQKMRDENQLQQALSDSDLEVHYQPVLDMKTGLWAGVEALLRWTHPERGRLSPEYVVTLAEETSLIMPLGEFVLEKACRDLVDMHAMRSQALPDAPPMFVGINVSPKQIGDGAFTNRVAALIEEIGLNPGNIKLEITESMTSDYQRVSAWVERCVKIGTTVAIDDFGTGYSSLEHLLELDVQTIKIDQAFVRDLKTGQRSEKMVRGIVGLAKSLEFGIIAEGIETEDQLNLLRDLGCDFGQGYYIGKPVPKDDILAALKTGK